MLSKWIPFFRENKAEPATSLIPEPELIEIRVFPPGREYYINTRRNLLEKLTGSAKPQLVFEQFSYQECFLMVADLDGNITLLTDRGQIVVARINWADNSHREQIRKRIEQLLGHTIKRDDLPLTGFGHAAFFFIIGRNVYVTRKHIPIIEKETNGFRELHRELLELKHSILDLA